MTRLQLTLLAALLAGLTLRAAADAPAPGHVVPKGYVFDQPRLLTQQRLFGLAHGVSLLSDACMGQPDQAEAAHRAYAAWHARQAPTIALAQNELAHYYFGPRAAEASWSDIVSALGLHNNLQPKPDPTRLKAACATLPQALARYHTDLAAQFNLQALLSRVTAATETEARVEFCRTHVPPVAGLDIAADTWGHAHDNAISAARRGLEQRWADSGLEGSLDLWLKNTRRIAQSRARREACAALPGWLASPDASPDFAFNVRP